MALTFKESIMAGHQHGPGCGHLAIHHFCRGGKQHIGFVEDNGVFACYFLAAPECQSEEKTCVGSCVGVLQKLMTAQCSDLVFPEDESKRVDTFVKCDQLDYPVKHREHYDHLIRLDEDTFTYHHIESQGECTSRANFFRVDETGSCAPPVVDRRIRSCSQECCEESKSKVEPSVMPIEIQAFCKTTWAELLHPESCIHGAKEDGQETGLLLESVLGVEGLCCSSEVTTLEQILRGIEGVREVHTNVVLKRAFVKHTAAALCEDMVRLLNKKQLEARIIRNGAAKEEDLEASIIVDAEVASDQRVCSQIPEWYVTIAILCWLVSLFHYIDDPPYLEYFKYVGIVSVVLCLPPILLRSFARLRDCVMDINALMAIAVVGAIGLGDYSEAAAVVSLFSVSNWLESRATHKVRIAMEKLLALKPEVAVLASGNDSSLGEAGSRVLVEKIPVGTKLIVNDGDKVPLDGYIIKGETSVDESVLTGESYPVQKGIQDAILAGTLNVGGKSIEICTTALSNDTTVSRMIRLIEGASQQRSPREQLVERIAAVYTPVVAVTALLLASIPWAWGEATGLLYTEIALILLVVACPCAFVISTPITYVCGLARAARYGILVKGGRHLETLGHLKTVCLDKTGTLTRGEFALIKAVVLNSSENLKELYDMLYNIETGSSHPLAAALCKMALEKAPEIKYTSRFMLVACETLPGEGVRGVLTERGQCCQETQEDRSRDEHDSDEEKEDDCKGQCCQETQDDGSRDDEEKEDDCKGQCCQETQDDGSRDEHDSDEEKEDDCKGKHLVELYVGNEVLAERLGWMQADAELRELCNKVIDNGSTLCILGGAERAFVVFEVGDEVRAEARNVVDELRRKGLSVHMLTGDNQGTANRVGRSVGIDSVHGGMLPEGKAELLKKFPAPVAMVGDGVNDALSLATADVSIGVGNGQSKIAMETADVALMRNDLSLVLQSIKIGRSCARKIQQNLSFSILTKLLVVVITFTIFPSLWLAIAADVGAMLLVTLNSMAILSTKYD